MQAIKTHELHPHDLNNFSCYEEVSKDIEKRIVDFFANGETEIKLSVSSGKGSKSPTNYKCTAKTTPVKNIGDCEFSFVDL
jgi:hypothetical protein